MQLQSTSLQSLLGAIVLSAGLTSSIALADEPSSKSSSQSDKSGQSADTTKGDPSGPSPDRGATAADSTKDDEASKEHEGMVEVRISMPDGRTIIRYEAPSSSSARLSFDPGAVSATRTLADGSKISYGRAGASGGSNSTSSRAGGGGSSSGGGGGSSSGGGGGGGGGSTSASGGGSGSSESGSSGATSTPSRGGGGIYSSSSSSQGDPVNDSHSTPPTPPVTVPTIGDPDYGDDGAVGGQRVEFNDAGMAAVVLGNTVYFNGVQVVRSDKSFGVVAGTKVGGDAVIRTDGRPVSDEESSLQSWNTAASAIKLDFPSDTIVELVMLSNPDDLSNPDREQRTWTVRIR